MQRRYAGTRSRLAAPRTSSTRSPGRRPDRRRPTCRSRSRPTAGRPAPEDCPRRCRRGTTPAARRRRLASAASHTAAADSDVDLPVQRDQRLHESRRRSTTGGPPRWKLCPPGRGPPVASHACSASRNSPDRAANAVRSRSARATPSPRRATAVPTSGSGYPSPGTPVARHGSGTGTGKTGASRGSHSSSLLHSVRVRRRLGSRTVSRSAQPVRPVVPPVDLRPASTGRSAHCGNWAFTSRRTSPASIPPRPSVAIRKVSRRGHPTAQRSFRSSARSRSRGSCGRWSLATSPDRSRPCPCCRDG